MTSGRAAGFGILQEPFEYRIEVSWRFPERGVPQPAEAMTAALPHIGIRDGTDICRGAISYQVCYGRLRRSTGLDRSEILLRLSNARGRS
jgi:hypothetical protein